ncbi:MAG: hypothetical protein GY786_25385 [Proteobacteria bacterium]|nr:hypothetical protein [Pseudomonadota bacterium]
MKNGEISQITPGKESLQKKERPIPQIVIPRTDGRPIRVKSLPVSQPPINIATIKILSDIITLLKKK